MEKVLEVIAAAPAASGIDTVTFRAPLYMMDASALVDIARVAPAAAAYTPQFARWFFQEALSCSV
jgi:hypothetical protein